MENHSIGNHLLETLTQQENTVTLGSDSRSIIMNELVRRGSFKFGGFIRTESRATTLVLFKQLGKYIGMSFDEMITITKDEKVTEEWLKEKEYTCWLKEACDRTSVVYRDNLELLEPYMYMCYELDKIPQNTGTAASGVIMGDDDIVLPREGDTFAYNGPELEEAGYIKYDLLSVDMLNLIQYFYGLDVNWEDLYDEDVWKETIQEADTDFVFQFGSDGMKNLIRKSKPSSIDELAELNSLFRPGPLGMGMADLYTDIKQGKNPNFTNEDRVMSKLLKDGMGDKTSGMVIMQEELMYLCRAGADFTMSEADDIRKACGKKKMEILDRYEEQFVKNWKYPEYYTFDSDEIVDNDPSKVYLKDDVVKFTDGTSMTAEELHNIISNR